MKLDIIFAGAAKDEQQEKRIFFHVRAFLFE